MDLTESIAPKSDQLNAEDLLSGPRTVQIESVTSGSAEQPVNIHLVEFPGRPFRPSKTVRRILVAAWGADASAYVGRRMSLYRDASVRFGGQDVGGVRVSHLSHISKRLTLALTVTRGKRSPYSVDPLPDGPPIITNEQAREIAESIEKAVDRAALDAIGAQLKAFDLANHRGRLIELWKARLTELDTASIPVAKPEPAQASAPEPRPERTAPTAIDAAQIKRLNVVLNAEGLATTKQKCEYLSTNFHREITAVKDVTADEASELIDYLEGVQNAEASTTTKEKA